MKRTGKIVITLVTVLLLVFTAACAPAPGEVTPAPAPEEITPEEVTPAPPPEEITPEEVTPTPPPEEITPTPTVEWGTIEVRVTDPPPADVKSAVVYLTNVEVHKAGAEQEIEIEQEQSGGDNQTQEKKGKQEKQQTQQGEQEQAGSGNQTQEQEQEQQQTQQGDGAWIPIIGAPPSFNLMDVIGVEQLLGSTNVTAGKYTQIRMDVDRVEVETVDGDNFTAEVPSGKLKIVRPFDVEAGTTTVLTLDFDGSKSLIITAKGKALFKPVVKLLVKHEKVEVEVEEAEAKAAEKKGKKQ